MQIRARMSMTADGCVTTPDGWPAQLADPAFVSGQSHGKVFVLASHRPAGTPDEVVTDSDPARLRERIRDANQGGDVHLVGGLRTIDTYRALGALDKLHLVVLPLLLGDGLRLTPSLSSDTKLTFEREIALTGGSVEIVYACDA
jgi:dihydrofolate reductase